MNPIHAGFWRRVAAFMVDSLILFVPQILVSFGLGGGTAATLLNIVVAAAYFAGFHSSAKQATPGKMAFGIRVTDMQGGRISVGRAIGRYFATWLSAIILAIGYLMAAFTERKQALHDLVCKTLVVNKAAKPDEIAESNETMPVTGGVWAAVVLLFVVPFLGGIAAAIAIPAYQDYHRRATITDAIRKVDPIQKEVSDALSNRRPAPAGTRSIDSPAVQQVVIARDGQITVVLSPDAVGGGQVLMAPLVSRTGGVEWRCWAEGLAPKYLPAACRGG